MPPTKIYDYLVIGGGSGGLASARRAASYGAKVAIIERKELGGTCVNVGCVPKKVMLNAANVNQTLKEAGDYCFHIKDIKDVKFDWSAFKIKRDAYIHRLHGIYDKNLKKDNIDLIKGFASFIDKDTVKVKTDKEELVFSAKNILIAVGTYL